MQNNKTIILLFLLLCAFACTEEIPDFELGCYEYAGIDDSQNWRFFRVENNGAYREVMPKATGLGELKQYSLCDENLFEQRFYDCGAYPSSGKPYPLAQVHCWNKSHDLFRLSARLQTHKCARW